VIGRADNDDAGPIVDPGQKLEKKIDDLRPIFDVFALQSSAIGDSVQFINEQDRWR
jgi:hypothetical protein